jgi:hypothetical protein
LDVELKPTPSSLMKLEVSTLGKTLGRYRVDLPLNGNLSIRGKLELDTKHSKDYTPTSQPFPLRCFLLNLFFKSGGIRPTQPPNMVMDVDTIPNHLADQRDAAPDDLQHYFLQFEDFWERKLWHELTNNLIEYFELPESAPQRLSLYNTFIKSFAEKINKLKLVTLGLSAATQCKSM